MLWDLDNAYKWETGVKLESVYLSLATDNHPPREAKPKRQRKRSSWTIHLKHHQHLLTASFESAEMRSLLLALILLAWAEAKRLGGHHRHHQNCFAAEDVQEGYVPTLFRSRATRWERQAPVQLVPYVEGEEASPRRQRRHHETTCPDLKVQGTLNREIHERSISPWTYRIDEDEDRYPRKLSIAECLCKGCIDVKTGQEVTSLNSVPVFQNMMVLRRKPCQHNDEAAGFTFEVKYIDVSVACACVLPRYSS
ncbi:interleukin-17C [Podarcis raffonei]|uniref:interleukin-17C n=1 Tax=Podarcis raffonei TaxID=65483 RepID=UPI00232920F7|nr:interleukin-17C [Podarcis raffonei]